MTDRAASAKPAKQKIVQAPVFPHDPAQQLAVDDMECDLDLLSSDELRGRLLSSAVYREVVTRC